MIYTVNCYNSMTKQINIEVPLSLSDISLRQYQDYLRMYDKWDKEDEVYFKTKVLQIFCNLSLDDTFKIPIVEFDSIIQHVLDLFKEETPLIHKFTMTGKDKDGNDAEIEFGFVPKLDEMSFGEFIDLETNYYDWQKSHKTMAILYRPIIQSKKDFYLIDDYAGTSRFSDVMLDMPVNVALGAMVFFYRLGSKLPSLTLDYLQMVLKKEGVPQQLKQTLGKDGDGIVAYIHSLKAMLEESMKLQKRDFIHVF